LVTQITNFASIRPVCWPNPVLLKPIIHTMPSPLFFLRVVMSAIEQPRSQGKPNRRAKVDRGTGTDQIPAQNFQPSPSGWSPAAAAKKLMDTKDNYAVGVKDQKWTIRTANHVTKAL
jgi:hypothetical protein